MFTPWKKNKKIDAKDYIYACTCAAILNELDLRDSALKVRVNPHRKKNKLLPKVEIEGAVDGDLKTLRELKRKKEYKDKENDIAKLDAALIFYLNSSFFKESDVRIKESQYKESKGFEKGNWAIKYFKENSLRCWFSYMLHRYVLQGYFGKINLKSLQEELKARADLYKENEKKIEEIINNSINKIKEEVLVNEDEELVYGNFTYEKEKENSVNRKGDTLNEHFKNKFRCKFIRVLYLKNYLGWVNRKDFAFAYLTGFSLEIIMLVCIVGGVTKGNNWLPKVLSDKKDLVLDIILGCIIGLGVIVVYKVYNIQKLDNDTFYEIKSYNYKRDDYKRDPNNTLDNSSIAFLNGEQPEPSTSNKCV